MSDLARLRAALGTPELAWLRARLRTRLERYGELTGSLTVSGLSQPERTAFARLLSRPVRAGTSVTVPLDGLDAVLRRGLWPAGLESAVVALTGPVVHPDERRTEQAGWEIVAQRLRAIGIAHPTASTWVDSLARTGAIKRASHDTAAAMRLIEQLTALANALPRDLESIAILSGRLFGDAHALDAGTSLGRLAVGLAAALGHGDIPHSTAQARRDVWATVGVVVDELSSWVLTLGLPGGSSSPTARALSALIGQPAILTYRQLISDDIGIVPPVVHVCENPAVVAAAANRASTSNSVLVCLNGQPGAAAVRLLRRLSDGGASLVYHGDFDAGGMSIARTLRKHVAWDPWRFSASDYMDAIGSLRGLSQFTDAVGDTPWDPELARTLATHRRRVEEESVIDSLLDDLS